MIILLTYTSFTVNIKMLWVFNITVIVLNFQTSKNNYNLHCSNIKEQTIN